MDVVLSDGEPTLRVRTVEAPDRAPSDDLDARLTLRLPESLKRIVEDAADGTGESVNSWVVKTLATRARPPRAQGASTSGSGEFET